MKTSELLDTALLTALTATWRRVAREEFGNTLRPPTLVLSDSHHHAGLWRSDVRELAISRHVAHRHAWATVVEVLRHEMAHQYVSEVLNIANEPPHGPAFQRVCAERGIDATAAGLMAGQTEPPPTLTRIRKLLALAESPERHEAEAAMRTAQRLMLKHNLESVDSTPNYVIRHLGPTRRRTPIHEKLLGGILGAHFFVTCIRVPSDTTGAGTVLEICGTPDNVSMAEWVWSFVSTTAARLWVSHRAANRLPGNRERRRFLAGVMTGFYDKLQDQERSNTADGLIHIGDPALEEFIHRRHPRLRTRRRSTYRTSRAWQAGRDAGRDIVLHRPVEGTSRQRGHLLKG